MMTVQRDGRTFRVYKRTYVFERMQQGEAGVRIPTSRLEKIVATSQQTKLEALRTCKAACTEILPSVPEEEVAAHRSLRIGSNLAVATEAAGVYEWWLGRVQYMYRKSSGKTGKYVPTSEPILFDEAQELKMKVVCNWYKKHARSLFTYDGPVDDAQYPLENCLGMVDLDLPNARGQYSLRDPGQARRLNTALDYTRPAPTPGAKKRTCGEVQLAAQDRHTREHRCTADEGVVRNAAIFNRGEGKRKSHAPGTVNV